jgi:hypothetical protein
MDVPLDLLHQVHLNVPVNVVQELHNMYQAMLPSSVLVILENLDEAKAEIHFFKPSRTQVPEYMHEIFSKFVFV